MKRKRALAFGLVLVVAEIGLAGPCLDPNPCAGVRVDSATVSCCVWDHGCWLNPFEPDNQWWCETIDIYWCLSGGFGHFTTKAEECGPCCEPQTIPAPVVPPAPIGGP